LKSVGIIVEYNPFHNGHKYHVQKARETCNPDCIIAVMSGNFLQRGEPALLSKWSRAQMALLNGVDLIIELPYYYATQSANNFAYGGVTLLEKLGVEHLVFGSEDGNIESFLNSAKELDSIVFKNKDYSKSFPRSFIENTDPVEIDMGLPNNILGVQYVSNILKNNYNIKPLSIKREKANYHDQTFNDERIASATSIRNKILNSKEQSFEEIFNYVPLNIKDLIINDKNNFKSWEDYFNLLKYRLVSSDIYELSSIFLVEEGIEHRILKYISNFSSFSELMTALKTKRYTWTRIQRTLLNILINHKKHEIEDKSLSYARVLGFNSIGREYLNKNKKNIDIQVVTSPKNIQNRMLDLDLRASRVYCLGLNNPSGQELFEREFLPPIIIK
jgi:predicted nucleotidyltransferase